MDYSQALNIGKPLGDTLPPKATATITQLEEIGAVMSKVAFSAVMLGAFGGLARGLANSKGFSYTFKAVILGAILSMVFSPFINTRLSGDLVPLSLFLIGYCGLQGVDFTLNLLRNFAERHFEDIIERIVPALKAVKHVNKQGGEGV